MRHSLSKDTAFNGETTPRHTFLCSDSQCLPPGDPRILCAKHGSPITGKSFILDRAVKSVMQGVDFLGIQLDFVDLCCKLTNLQSSGIVLCHTTVLVRTTTRYCWFSVSRHSKQIKIKIKTVQQIKSRIWEMKGGTYTKTLAKIQVRGIFRT